ncbi:hypothetical protein RIF29_08864 [Crotalaria pallida]|uniref:Uncharacterized protein n=1 Tax=Crotalaria pallida TaxID=3830 RepID=A0AAN9ILK7_CROPI
MVGAAIAKVAAEEDVISNRRKGEERAMAHPCDLSTSFPVAITGSDGVFGVFGGDVEGVVGVSYGSDGGEGVSRVACGGDEGVGWSF